MGRPVTVRPRPPGTSRRGFFKASGSAAAALAAAPLVGIAGSEQLRADVFQHGVASGDPLSDRVILWTRVTPATPVSVVVVDYVIARDPALTQVVRRGTTKTNPARDYTVKVDPTGLLPDTTYYYRFTADGQPSPVGRTKTLPVGTASRLRIAVVSCSNHAYGYFNAYGRLAVRADLDLVVHLGDYIYEYGNLDYGDVRATEPATEIVTLSDYRTRHAQYKRDPDSQAMHRQHPFVAIWDDHETTNNAFVTGAQNHNPAVGEGSWAGRVNVALQAYYEWMPARPVDTADLRRNYRSYVFGDLVELMMLEQRLVARSEQLPGNQPAPNASRFTQTGPFLDPARQLLGAEQEAWLFDKLRTTPARWKLLGQGVMFMQAKTAGAANADGGGVFFNSDAWDGYQPARDRVFDVIKGAGGQRPVDNVVVLTGDIHSSWAADLTQDPNNPNPAAGGYDKATGTGSLAVEFVGTSVSSPGVENPQTAAGTSALFLSQNPHLKYSNFNRRGYMLLDVTPQRAVCEWWHLDTVATPSSAETFATGWQTLTDTNRLQPTALSGPVAPVANPPALAP